MPTFSTADKLVLIASKFVATCKDSPANGSYIYNTYTYIGHAVKIEQLVQHTQKLIQTCMQKFKIILTPQVISILDTEYAHIYVLSVPFNLHNI